MDGARNAQSEPLWYVFLDGKVKGPFDEDLLKQMVAAGMAQADTPIAIAGSQEWKPLGERFPNRETGPCRFSI